jgi:hypothetical protein
MVNLENKDASVDAVTHPAFGVLSNFLIAHV